MCSKLKINTVWHSSGVFIADFNRSQHMIYCSSSFNSEQVFARSVWKANHNVLKTEKTIYLFRNKSCKAFFMQWFIIAPYWNKLWTNEHIMNIIWTYVSPLNFLLGIPSLLSSFQPVFRSALSSLFPRY